MKTNNVLIFIAFVVALQVSSASLFAQNENCFLEDFSPKIAEIPLSVASNKTNGVPTVTVTLSADTLGKISKYVFGNAIAVWIGNITGEATFVKNTQLLNPSLIRFPGGSWSNIFFWDGAPSDVPDSAYDSSGKRVKFYAISGRNDWPTTTDNYYKLRQQTGSQGLITVNYGYARYGLSDDPVAQAAHHAAEWVRYDNGRTKFWEIGNENAGPWEAGWMIDTSVNKDGQPEIISGQLYGQHFRVFADSMRAAATEVGTTIYIGAQVLHHDGTNSWNSVDKTWNAGVFSEVGDAADFYVMHNYFGKDANAENLLTVASTEPEKNISFIQQDIANKNAFPRPVAITEYNMNFNSANETMGRSYINGMQATVLFNELIKNNIGLGARWLLANGEDGMFYLGDNYSLRWQPRPEFYYAYYQQKFTGDHAIAANSSNSNILAYASRFASGETGVVIVNKGKTAQVVEVDPLEIGVGNQFYTYSLTGGTDNGDFSYYVSVNGEAATGTQWGPRETLETIPANAFPVDDTIKLDVPARSVQFIMIAGNTGTCDSVPQKADKPVGESVLCQNDGNKIYSTSNDIHAASYEWALDPFDAGMITLTDTLCTVNWNKDFNGTAYLCVKALNRCGEGEWSDTLIINIQPSYTNSENLSICSGDSVLIADNWIKESGTYFNNLTTFQGCDSVIVTNLSVTTLPDIYLGPDTTVNSPIILDAGSGFESYLWSTGEAFQTIQVDSTSGSDAQIIYVTVSDSNNCMNSDTIIVTVELTPQIIDLHENHNFRLYPNPSQGTLYIESDHPDRNTVIEIYSTKGTLLLSKEFNSLSRVKFNIDDFDEGTYVIRFISGNSIKSQKIVLKK
jgi:hypothetical protein